MSNIKAAIFDIYGVLGLNGWQAFKLKHFESRPDSWDDLRAIGQEVDAGRMQTHELVTAVAGVTGVREEEVRKQLDDTLPNTELVEFIRTLKPMYKIGVLSNASRADIVRHIFAEKDQQLFDVVVTSFHVGYTKPDEAMFRIVCEQLGVRPDQCIFIDDQERHLKAGADYGMKTVLYKSASQTIRDVTELLKQ
jgi:epoxide hydrolase-like predicted phosphatase